MRPSRVLPFALLIIGSLALVWRWRPLGSASVDSVKAAVAGVPRPAAGSSTAPIPSDAPAQRISTLERLAYAQAWDGPQPGALAAFRDWAERYRGAAVNARPALEAEGISLVRARRAEMLELIQRDPRRALALTVPAVIRQLLPAAVLAGLEARISGTGDFMWVETTSPADNPGAAPRSRRVAYVNGVTYDAHIYGRREALLAKEGASLHGIALDGHLALHENPLRVLEPGEIPSAAAETHCPVSNLAVVALPPGQGVNLSSLDVVEANGRVLEFCGGDAMLPTLETRLLGAEDQAGPRVRAQSAGGSDESAPATAADAPTSHTIGPQRVLVVRIDFVDFVGEPVSVAAAQDMMDNNVRPFLENASYGATTIVTTVSANVYRMAQSGNSYALAGSDVQLHADARNAAAANYTLSNFDRVVVMFANLGRITNSKITFGGEGSVGGTNVWINGTFSLRVLIHELGHTYGLKHANLWQVSDGNPASGVGGSVEYKDPFDAMGDSSTADSRFHYNLWSKNRLGWLPDSAVQTVTTSGTYRVYRFDHKDAPRNQTQALRVFRDGVHWYWIGLRQNFTSNASLSSGAYVVWGTNSLQQTQLLDLTTPGSSSTDAALAVEATFNDPLYGISIKPVARGGSDPQQWIDVEITVPPVAPPSVVTAWGREGAFFYDSAGLPTAPRPETLVPFGLVNVQAIAGGDQHMVALQSDGTVVVWGNDLQGQTGVPIGLADVVAVAAGGNNCGALKRDGTVRLWGDLTTGVTTVPAGLTGVRQLVIGSNHALALKTDGTVVAWGNNSNGQTTVPTGLANVIAVAAGDRTSIALKADGTVTRWGTSFSGVPFPTGLSGVVAISSLTSHVLALKSDGTVVGWGNDANGQSTVPAGLNGVVGIAAGGFHSLALKADGTIVAWGSNTSGQTNVPPSMPRGFALACTTRSSFALTGPHVFLTTQPASQTVSSGGSATLSVGAVGGAPLTYQWRKDGSVIAGATGTTLILGNVAASAAGTYDVVVSDGTSTITTFPVRLTISAPPPPPPTNPDSNPGRLVNLSILTGITSATDTFTMGTVVGGSGTSGTKPLLVRAAGPSLGALGVAGTLTDPALEFFVGATKVGENDNWGGTVALGNAFTQVGAFPYSAPTSRDAAIYSDSVAPGNNSIRVSGVNGATGTVIAELYDSTPASAYTAATPRLINVSVLKQIGTGFTVGFVLGGGTSRNILVRAVGPGLAALGVGGTVPDPQLVFFAGTTKTGENDNWGGGGTLTAAFTQVGAFVLPPASRDAALLVNLAPGSYSVQVSGVAGATGLVLVEVYEAP